MVPPPATIHKNLFIIGIDYTANIDTKEGSINLGFDLKHPFNFAQREAEDGIEPDPNTLLELIADASIDRINPDKPTFLFHSAGKDSNIIALALAEAGWQDRVTLVTHKSDGPGDESILSKEIAKSWGLITGY